ncbi:uncharacterized protein LOC143226376 isoform X3 [Tachypleus tridentatus]
MERHSFSEHFNCTPEEYNATITRDSEGSYQFSVHNSSFHEVEDPSHCTTGMFNFVHRKRLNCLMYKIIFEACLGAYFFGQYSYISQSLTYHVYSEEFRKCYFLLLVQTSIAS